MKIAIEDKLGANLLDCIEEKLGLRINTPCARRGTCGACKVRILKGLLKQGNEVKKCFEEANSCRSTIASEFLEIEIRDSAFANISKIEADFKILKKFELSKRSGMSVALDIGTTTIAALLFENSSGKILKKASALNGQTKYADNVIERINCAQNPQKLTLMHESLIDSIERLLIDFDGLFDRMFVSANTSMLHLFCNVDPSSMGVFPYTPKFLEAKKFSSRNIFPNLNEFEISILASASAFIGADVVAGAMAADFKSANNPSLFVDIGTNGEILLNKGGEIFSASAAAGPAFEGHGLAFGMRADSGAISKIDISDSFEVKIETIDNMPPRGICGSAYVDFLAAAKEAGLIGSSGRFLPNTPTKIYNNLKAFEVTSGIFITEEDIANLLKSKAAISAAISVLLEEKGVENQDIKTLFIAGGFGKNLNFSNAIKCGLIPEFSANAIFLGNSALAGAYICALEDSAILEEEKLSKEISNIDLNQSEYFEDRYIDSLFLS